MSVKTELNVSEHVNREQSETMLVSTDSRDEADGLDLSIHTLSVIKVEYYRSYEYHLKWEESMYPRRSSRQPKASTKSPQRSPSPNEEVIQRRLRSKRQKGGLKKTQAGDSVVNEERGLDIIDIIDSTHDAKRVAEEDEGKFVEVADKGVDESDEDRVSVTSSVTSGPSVPFNATPEKQRPLQDLCSACRKLYQKAKKSKAPVKSKLLDTDPKSLTCDQWILIKTWRPQRLLKAKGMLLTHVQLVKKRLKVKKTAKQIKQCVGEGESASCSRPHTFLQRNLRRCVKVPVKKEMKKKNRRKRRRNDSQGSRVAKQQRLLSNNDHQHISTSCADHCSLPPANGQRSSPGFESCSDHESDDLTIELIPTSVTLEISEPRAAPPKQKGSKKTGGFRDLLAQLRGNSSMIVRETR